MKTVERPDRHALPPTETDLTSILDEYLAALRRGEHPSKEDLLRAHPQIAGELSGCLNTLDVLEGCSDFDASADSCATDADSCATGSASATARTLGDFRIIREIGRGGMGVVYEAEQISLGRRVALKVLPFASMLDERQLQRFKNEARAAATLNHPNIVPVYWVGCERGVHFYAMQYIEGQTLAALIEAVRVQRSGFRVQDAKDEGQWTNDERRNEKGHATCAHTERGEEDNVAGTLRVPSPHTECAVYTDTVAAALSTLRTEKPRDYYRRIAELGIQAAEALDHAHQLGIVHRDIKPANLLIEFVPGPRSQVPGLSATDHGQRTRNVLNPEPRSLNPAKLWITDFGLARLPTDAGMTMTGDLLGTLRYMSPEQALARRITVDHRTDIYSLGITLYELLALQPAFNGADREEVLRQIAFDEPTLLCRLKPSIPVELETIIHKSISKSPDDRYATARDLVDDLALFCSNQPIRAKPPGLATRVVRWIGRHRGMVTSALTVVVTALSLTAGLQWRARTQIEAKNQELEQAQARTRTTLQFAREAVDDMYSEFASNWLADQPRLTAKELEFLAKAANIYERLVDEFPADRALKVKAAAALIKQALASYQTQGDDGEKRDASRKALALLNTPGIERIGLELEYWRAVAWLSYAQSIGPDGEQTASPQEEAAAVASAEAAIEALESSVRQRTGDGNGWGKLLRVQRNAADVFRNSLRGVEYQRASIQTAKQWLALKPADEDALRESADAPLEPIVDAVSARRLVEVAEEALRVRPSRYSRESLAVALLYRANWVDAAQKGQLLTRCVRLYETLTEDFPDVGPFYGSFFVANSRLVAAQLNQGDVAAALQTNERSLRVAERLRASIPFNDNYSTWPLEQLRTRAGLMWILERREEAERCMEEAAQLAALMMADRDDPSADPLAQQYGVAADELIHRTAMWITTPEIRDKLMTTSLAFLDRAPDDWNRDFQIFQYHPDDKRAEAAFVEMQRQLRKEARGSEIMLLINLAGPQLKGPFRRLSNDQEAFDVIERVCQLSDSDVSAAWSDYGWALYRRGNYAAALEWLNKARNSPSYNRWPYPAFGLALAQVKLGYHEEAKAPFRHGVEFLRRKNVLQREEISALREAAAAMGDETIVEELLRDRWPVSAKKDRESR